MGNQSTTEVKYSQLPTEPSVMQRTDATIQQLIDEQRKIAATNPDLFKPDLKQYLDRALKKSHATSFILRNVNPKFFGMTFAVRKTMFAEDADKDINNTKDWNHYWLELPTTLLYICLHEVMKENNIEQYFVKNIDEQRIEVYIIKTTKTPQILQTTQENKEREREKEKES